ncbi:hypothetical protein GCM10023185_09440 [Hymenobacter saemangeumensis]|uniref:Cyclase n=1 Tax=Hymenobacter saemangeumensis TaxID=1084522 RepID=A0ABP8I4C5_9BACT
MENPIHTHLSHEVEDFTTWKQHFDEGAALREKHGIKIHGVYQAHDNPNMVTVHGELAHPDSLNNFMADPDGMPSMQRAGVKGRPDMKMMRKHS